jgi:hypothetical protein
MAKRAHNFIDITGKRFNRLLIIKFSHTKDRKAYWECLCDCGNKSIVEGYSIRSGHIKSCGCLQKETMTRLYGIDLTNKVFERLTIIAFFKKANYGKKLRLWKCVCICGKDVIASSDDLLNGHTKSCGCLQKERVSEVSITHGMTKTRIYRIWAGMKDRCTNSNTPCYNDYGGRGITLCPEWQTFEGFFSDEGESYYKHVKEFGEKNTTADRFPNVNGNYEKGNFRWATRKEQGATKRTSSRTKNLEEHIRWKKKLSSSLNGSVRSNFPYFDIERYLGCTLKEFREYIESLFTDRMTWYNHGNGFDKWQFDHILGCNNFDLSMEEERLICWNYKNLRPMWHVDHKKKSKVVIDFRR